MNYNQYKIVGQEIMKNFQEMDRQNSKAQKILKINCSNSCNGVCCSDKNVEVSPVDLIPLAIEMIDSNNALNLINELKSNEGSSCIFHKQGKCTIYEKRATLCRLFGWSAVYNKQRKSVLSICSHIEHSKINCPVVNSQVPNLVDWTQRNNLLCPDIDSKPLPFNKALLFTLEFLYTKSLYENE